MVCFYRVGGPAFLCMDQLAGQVLDIAFTYVPGRLGGLWGWGIDR
jgi:hypothetical protein